MSDDGPEHTPTETGDFVLVTYRQIAERFRLGSPKAARTKVKRAGWAHDPPNHPADPLHIRVPRGSWDQADGATSRRQREVQGPSMRDPGPQEQETRDINGFEAVLNVLQEQLHRERSRADRSEARVRELTDQIIDLREGKAAALAKAEAAETRVNDLVAEVRKMANAQGRVELLQIEVDRLRAETEQLKAQASVPAGGSSAVRRRPLWAFWRPRPG
jgi:hypothetical protein